MSHPQRIGLHLTDRCQLDCQHCLRDPDATPTDLPIAFIRDLVRDASGLFAIRWFSLTGGEPTLHPSFPDVLDAIVAVEGSWDMVTNGERFERVVGWLEAAPERRRSLRSITFSVDGDEPTHDRIRGDGSYRRVLSAIALATAAGLPFGVQMAVHAGNAGVLEAVGLLAAQIGAKHVSFPMTQPTGTHLDRDMFLSTRDWNRVRDRVVSLGRALSITVVLPEGYPTDQPMALCSALRSETLHVDVHGRLTLCCQHSDVPSEGERDVAGSIEEESLSGAYRRLLSIIHETTMLRLDAVERGEHRRPWGRFACNECLRSFGKPHWTEDGAAGPRAARERWRGTWAKAEHTRRRLQVVE